MKSKIKLLGITSLLLSISFLMNALQNLAVAQITATPNDAGTVVNQNGNRLNIEGGTEAGKNLFHSFEKFGVNKGQTANFISKPDIENILGRVTGGDASVINGFIQVTGGNSNLYLMNPAGIIFGSDASLNVPAAFTATTGNGIGFGDKWFNAFGTNDYASLFGNPDAFAFTQAGAILNHGNLAVKPEQKLTLLGGAVINTGKMEAPGGDITVAAVPEEKLVRITQEGNLLSLGLPVETKAAINNQAFTPLSLPQLLTGGNLNSATGIEIENGVVKFTGSGVEIPNDAGIAIVSNKVDVSGKIGGKINIFGEKVGIVSANINASGKDGGGTVLMGGDYKGQGTVPNAQRTVIGEDSVVKADAEDTGNGGKVIAWADKTTSFYGTISARGGKISGDGGFVEVSGKENLAFDGKVDVGADFGKNGELLLDPAKVEIVNTGSDDNQLNNQEILSEDIGGTFIISADKVEEALNTGDVKIEATDNIDVKSTIDTSLNENTFDLTLKASIINIDSFQSIKVKKDLNLQAIENINVDRGNIQLNAGRNLNLQSDITIPPTDNETLGEVILSAKNHINVNGNISLGNFSLNGSFTGENSALTLNSSEGGISVAGNINAGNTKLISKKDINVENIEILSSDNFGSGEASDFVSILSETGKITVNTISVQFGSLDIKAADVFRAKGTFPSSFANTGDGDESLPVSIQANNNGSINIQHGGVKFTEGIGVEKDADGTVFKVKANGTRIFIRGKNEGQIIFVDKNENPVADRPITVESVDFDVNNILPDESFTTGLIIQKGGTDAGLYGAFGDTFLDGSSNIDVVAVPKPNEPTTDISSGNEISNGQQSNGGSSDNETSNGQQSPDGQIVQRQLNKKEQNSACSLETSPVAFNREENTREGNVTNSPSSNNNPCRTTDDNNILKVIPDNRINSNSALPTFLFRLGKD